ncbi:hypothetical protein [Luteolibacter luteus]|uniref:Uncharacterized protein n=1 Tax=Luteolibacter luteus TaxID=2728835 RepID=A0A858RMK3_9BACT|nr:hypothetical protein [Luteolibacter luteus]QJE97599.1 hypothetical protein HHL09_18035 [Luteolibacter luteus]
MADSLTQQPFFDTLGQPAAPHAPGVNAAATARMERVLKSPVDAPGRGILLRAPRAGYGKTHLLSHVQQRLGSSHEFLPLTPLDGSRTDAAGAIEAALRRLTRPLPAGGGLTNLDLLARRLFSLALQPLVTSGEVPCQDREAALSALRQRPVETFDFHHSQAVTAHWTKENFEVLGPRLALELSRRTGVSLNEASFWLASFFRFAVAVPEHPGRTGMIIQSAVTEAGVERYAALLALLSLISRVAVTADDLEGMHAEPTSALRFASFLASVRQDAPRVDLIVSLNDDIWESAFVPALSGGLLDRLGEVEIRLEPLDEASAFALLEARLPQDSAHLAHKLALAPGEFYARRVLKKASELAEEQDGAPVRLLASESIAEPVTVVTVASAASAAPAMEDSFVSSLREEDAGVPPIEESVFVETPVEVVPPPLHQGSTPPPIPPSAVSLEPEPGIEDESVSPFSEKREESVESFSPAEPVMAVETPHFQPSQSPFQVAEPEVAVASGENPEPVGASSGGDRIDDLLRQFRERYGRE